MSYQWVTWYFASDFRNDHISGDLFYCLRFHLYNVWQIFIWFELMSGITEKYQDKNVLQLMKKWPLAFYFFIAQILWKLFVLKIITDEQSTVQKILDFRFEINRMFFSDSWNAIDETPMSFWFLVFYPCALLFFAAYVICKKNYSVGLFFFSPKLPTLFIPK